MKKIRITITSICCVLLASTSLNSQSLSKNQEAIHKLVADYAVARESQDREKIQVLFTSDCDQLVSTGEWRRGLTQMLEGMQRSTTTNPGTRKLIVETIRFFNRTIAIVDARYEIKNTETGSERLMWSTFVVVKKNQTWRIAAIRNMLPSG